MKQALLKTLERMGYVLIRADAWREAQRWGAEPQGPGHAADQLENQLAECRNQLSACASERYSLATRIGRAEASVQALTRQRDHLQAELTTTREQLARADTAGRIRELETANTRVKQRLADLEVYLKETRGTKGPRYL